MTRTCLNMTYGEMMRKHLKMPRMARRILKLSSEKSPHHLPAREAGPTPETRRKDPRGLGHLGSADNFNLKIKFINFFTSSSSSSSGSSRSRSRSRNKSKRRGRKSRSKESKDRRNRSRSRSSERKTKKRRSSSSSSSSRSRSR